MSARTEARVRLVGGLVLWFAVLGGAVAWAVHLMAAWSVDELTCAAGSDTVSAMPLGLVVGLSVAIPGVVALASLAAALLAWRRTAQARRAGHREPSVDRSWMLAVIGVWANLLFVTIIALGGVAVLVLPPCQR